MYEMFFGRLYFLSVINPAPLLSAALISRELKTTSNHSPMFSTFIVFIFSVFCEKNLKNHLTSASSISGVDAEVQPTALPS